jgi:hypothetical protein
MILLGLEIAIPVIIGSGIKLYNDWLKKQELYRLRKDMVAVVNDSHDVDDVTEMLVLKATTAKLKKRLRYRGMSAIVKSIQYAEMKVGILTKTVANKMVIDKLIRDYMITPVSEGGLGMRICDAVKNYHVAVTMYFLPRHQHTICDEIGNLKTDTFHEALTHLGLDGSY